MRYCEDQTIWWSSISWKIRSSNGCTLPGMLHMARGVGFQPSTVSTFCWQPCCTHSHPAWLPHLWTSLPRYWGSFSRSCSFSKMLRMAWGLKRLKSSSKNFTNEWKSNFWLDLIPLDHDAVHLMAWNPVLVRIQGTKRKKNILKNLWASRPYFWEHWWIDTWLQNKVRKNRDESNIQSDHWESARAWNSLLDIFCLTPLSLLELCKHHWPPVTTTRLGIVELLQVKQRIAEVQNLWEMEVLRNGAVLNVCSTGWPSIE